MLKCWQLVVDFLAIGGPTSWGQIVRRLGQNKKAFFTGKEVARALKTLESTGRVKCIDAGKGFYDRSFALSRSYYKEWHDENYWWMWETWDDETRKLAQAEQWRQGIQ